MLKTELWVAICLLSLGSDIEFPVIKQQEPRIKSLYSHYETIVKCGDTQLRVKRIS